MYDLINVLPRSNLQFLISAIFFVTDCLLQSRNLDKLVKLTSFF